MRKFVQEDTDVDQEFQDVDRRLTNLEVPDVPVGGAFLWTGAQPPEKHLWCDGKSYSGEVYPELFKVLERRGGTPSPDESNNFMIPDLSVSGFKFVIRAEK